MGKLNINNGGVDTNKKIADIDERFGPYSSIEAADAALGGQGRNTITAGLTVGILTANAGVKEYWYQPNKNSGVLELIPKGGNAAENPTEGNLASFDENGNLVDSRKKTGDFAPVEQAVPLGDTGDVGKILERQENGFGWVEKPVDGTTPHIDQNTKHWMIGDTDTEVDAEGKSAYQIAVSQGYEGTESQWLASLKGEKGDAGNNGHNPNLGSYTDVADAPTTDIQDGDYIVVLDTTQSPVTGVIYKWNGTAWQSTGRDANQAYFGSGEPLIDTYIDNTELANPRECSLAKAKDAVKLKNALEGFDIDSGSITNPSDYYHNGYYVFGTTGNLYPNSPSIYFEIEIPDDVDKIKFLGWISNLDIQLYCGFAFGHYVDENFVKDYAQKFYNQPITEYPHEYNIDLRNLPEGVTHFRTTIKLNDSTPPTSIVNSFYCIFLSGDTVLEKIGDAVTESKTYTDEKVLPINLHINEIKNQAAILNEYSPYQDANIHTYLVDENNACFGWISTDGTVHLKKAEIEELGGNTPSEGVSENQFATIVGLLANGVDNVELENKPKMLQSLFNINANNVVINSGNTNHVNKKPCISIIDDDTIDYQFPSSIAILGPSSNKGGYFSIMLPFMLSLGAKHGKKIAAAVACEGHRVGLTERNSASDSYTALNENGNAVKFLHDNAGWNVFNHSMTAQLPLSSYFVDGINSQLANTILASSTFVESFSFSNTRVIDRLTGKWYEPKNASKEEWQEVPAKKYAQLYYQDYMTGDWYFHRGFDFEYSWGEWFKRAEELGLPFERAIVHNGNTTSIYTINAGRKFAYFSVRTNGTYNNPPIAASVNRVTATSGSSNVKSSYESTLRGIVDNIIANNSWTVLMTHWYEDAYRNYYVEGVNYPETEVYDPEWIVPLKHDEIVDMLGGIANYLETPPARLGISTWDEWHPAKGTQLRSLYDVLDYALTQGVEILTPWDAWQKYGNIINIGVDRNGQMYGFDSCEEQTPYTDEEKSYLTIGADMSVRYNNSKTQE